MSTSAEIVPRGSAAVAANTSHHHVRHRQIQSRHKDEEDQHQDSRNRDGHEDGHEDGHCSTEDGHNAPVRDTKSSPNKTYGRTRDGKVFLVPTTHDMVSELLDPRQPKNGSDMAVVAILALHIVVAYLLPAPLKRPVFALIYLFWRACYNVGIGYLLTAQSKHRLMVTWARKWKLFEDPATGANPRPWLYRLLRRELEAKMDPAEYKFDAAPLEYNAWLVFRRLVDLILMCDFVSYCLFAIVCGRTPAGEMLVMTAARWLAGIALVGFNLWVKLDAHRVVKDYAWYWGDFFYLIDAELTFDGVFEMAPHPMYSIGYAGYYGISMMAASYDVLFISILAHAAQFAFLVLVENPHIEKTYNPPPPRVRASDSSLSSEASHRLDLSGNDSSAAAAAAVEQGPRESPTPVHNMLGIKNLDLFRTTDYSLVLLLAYLLILTAFAPNTPTWQAVFVAHALLWRLWFSVGLGVILNGQSGEKTFTRHFLKYGESPAEAWRQWKGMYHLSLTMCHASFVAACWKMYNLPDDWTSGWVLLKHVVGMGLVVLHLWTAMSIYDSLGEFGWFFGDFFFDSTGKLTYKSIYRFLNNPERVLGTAGLWGAALITWSRAVFVLALSGHLLTLAFISYVEKPHMQKIYGRGLRKEAGLTKFLKRSLPPPVKGWQVSVDKVLDETQHFVDEFIEAARAKLAAGSSTIVKDTSALFNTYPARLTLSRIAPDLAGYDPKHYSLSVDGTALPTSASENDTGKESASARVLPKSVKTKVFQYGAPIRVRWMAPADHSKKDWIGLYTVADNRSRDVTEAASLGHWVPACSGVYDTMTDDDKRIISSDQPVMAMSLSSLTSDHDTNIDLVQGEVIFEGDRLWWTQGMFEFRYHHDGNHTVMAISEPFEVRIGRFEEAPPTAATGRDAAAAAAAVCEGAQDRETGAVSSPTPSSRLSRTAMPTLTIDTKTAEAAASAASRANSGMLSQATVAAALLPVVQNCLDRDPDIAPATADEPFGGHVERDAKYARRVVYAIHHMFGVEFAPEVVPADGNVRKLAWRVCHAKQVLAPYSMSHSRGDMTPVAEEFPEAA